MCTSNANEANKKSENKIDHDLVQWAYSNLNNALKGEIYERMISGLDYNGFDEALVEARIESSEKTIDYQSIRRKDYKTSNEYEKARRNAIENIFGSIGKKCWVEAPFFVDYGTNIKVGENFYANFNATFLDCSIIDIGDNVMVGPNVTITTASHPTNPTRRSEGEEHAKRIKIGNNVWLAANCVILPGVTIGNDVVVAAGAVVSKDVPNAVVVGGVPARILKHV